MKLLCIKEGCWVNNFTGRPTQKGPTYGEECLVLKTDEEGYYHIKGYEYDKWGFRRFFNPKYFIPLSEIDETEMVREHKVLTHQ